MFTDRLLLRFAAHLGWVLGLASLAACADAGGGSKISTATSSNPESGDHEAETVGGQESSESVTSRGDSGGETTDTETEESSTGAEDLESEAASEDSNSMADCDGPIEFADDVWADLVRANLGLAADEAIFAEDTSRSNFMLFPRTATVASLSGVECMQGLQGLSLWMSSFTDLSPLAADDELQTFDVPNGLFSDISPLAGHGRLSVLDISYSRVKTISPLSNLRDIKILKLRGLTLDAYGMLADYGQLNHLDVGESSIESLAPLQNHRLRTLSIDGTSLDAASCCEVLPLLLKGGTEVFGVETACVAHDCSAR